MYKSLGLSNGSNSQASTSTTTPRNQPPPPPSQSSATRLLWSSFLVWHLNEKASFDHESDKLCNQMQTLWDLSPTNGRETLEQLESRQEALRNDRHHSLAQKALENWGQELKSNNLSWEDWSDITSEERAQVEDVFHHASPSKEVIEHSLLQPPTPSASSPLAMTPQYNFIDPSAFSDADDDDDQMGFVDLKSYVDHHEVTSDSEFVSWNAETPQSSSHNPSPRISPRHMSLHSSFENIHAPVARPAENAVAIRKPGSNYIGPELVSSPPPSHTPSPLQGDEEEDFENFKALVRAKKIREFHSEAAEADIQLSTEIYNAQKHDLLTNQEISMMVSMHEKRMVLLRKTKDEERKKIVAAEREKRRAAIRERMESMDMQGALVVRRPRKNTITGYTSPLLSSSSSMNSNSGPNSGKPSAESSPEGFWSSAMKRLAPSPLDTPVANFNGPPSWDSPYEPDPLLSPQPVTYQSLSPSKLFSPRALEPAFPGAFDSSSPFPGAFDPKVPASRHEQQPSLSSSGSDNNSLWSHVGTPTGNGNGTAASSPPSEKGTLGSPQKINSALAQSTSTLGQSSTLGQINGAPQSSSSSTLKSSSVTPTIPGKTSPNTANAKTLVKSPVAHSASQKAGVPAPQPMAAQPAPMKALPPPAPIKKMVAQPMTRKVQPVKAPAPQPMQSKFSSQQYKPPAPMQEQAGKLTLPLAPPRQMSSSSASVHERWLPPNAQASLRPLSPPPPPPSAKSVGKKPEAVKTIEPMSSSRSAAPVLKPANNLPPPPPRVDAASSSKIESSVSSGWSSTGWQAPVIAPSMSSSTSSMSSAQQQSHQIWRPQEKPKQEEKRKQIEAKPEPTPVLKPASSSSSSTSKPATASSSSTSKPATSSSSSSQQPAPSSKKSKKSKSKPSVEIEEIPDEEEAKLSKDALPLDSRYLMEPIKADTGSKGKSAAKDAKAMQSPKPSKPSPYFDKVLRSDGDDDASSDGTVRISGGKGKDRKAPIPTDWANAGSDNKHVRWSNNASASSSNSTIPATSFAQGNSYGHNNGFASELGNHDFWKGATQELTKSSEKASTTTKKANSAKKSSEFDLEKYASDAIFKLQNGR